MKRYIKRVIVLFVAGILVSCGGGGDSPSSGSSGGGTPPGGNPGTPSDGSPGTPIGGSPGNGGSTCTAAAGARVEESDATCVTLSDGWTPADPAYGWSGGTAMQSNTVGAKVSFTFTGTSVRWIGALNRDGGIARVRLDGGQTLGVDMFDVDTFTRPREARVPVLTLNDLNPGRHTLTIEVTGNKNGSANSAFVVVDAFDVQPQIVSHLQESDPDVKYSANWVRADDLFGGKTLHWSGCCVHTSNEPTIGGANATEIAGEKVTLTFRGTAINWMGYRGPDAGIASVTVDGEVSPPVDLYSPSAKLQEVVFTKTGLADTTHTLTIEVTGLRNAAATGSKVVVDAFDVTTPGTRYQETPYQRRDRAAFRYTCPGTTDTLCWEGRRSRPWSEGFVVASPRLGATATFSFIGTSVSWITCQKLSCSGRAKVYIDGVQQGDIINNRQPEPIEGFQHTVFRKDGLTNGPHKLTIEVVSNGGYIVVDAFDVHDGKALAIVSNPANDVSVSTPTGGDTGNDIGDSTGTPTEDSTAP